MDSAQTDLFVIAKESPNSRIKETRPLWKHQKGAVDAAVPALIQTGRALFILPTGGGKSRTFNEIINIIDEPALIIAHRENLIDQAVKRALSETDKTVGVEKAWQYGHNEDIIVASIQTLSKDARLNRFDKKRFGLIVVDEAHHSCASSYRKVLDYFDAKRLGVTATPDRSDERKIANIFGRPVFMYEPLDAIKDGVLCDIVCHRAVISGLDLSTVKTTCGDYDQEDLDNAFKVEGVLQGVADTMLKEAGNRRAIIFTTSISNANRLAEIMNRHRLGCAMAVHSKLDEFEVKCRLKQHSNGEYQFLINVGICTEGYDDPAVSCIGLARPTQSRPLCAQMVGRGIRSAPGKETCRVIDFTGNLGIKHNLCTPVDVLGSQFDEDVVALAEKLIGEKKELKVTDALEMAKAIEDRKKLEELARASRIGATATAIYSKSKVDPFAVLKFGDEADRQRALDKRFGGSVPTDGQIEALKKFGVPITKQLTEKTAGALIGKLKERAALGLSRYKQVSLLRKYKVDAELYSMEQASRAIDAVAKNGWTFMPPWIIKQIESEVSR
jgi:superfamily II DNA or RNA helicase